MWRGVFALFFRSLRSDSRSVWVHALWLFLLLVIYIVLCIAQAQSIMFGAPGLRLFRYVIYCNAAFVTLLGISYFSSVISEEKEEDTLGLMTMAGINPLGILLGKSTTRLFQVFLLLALQYPFTLLAITLGGLTREQIIAGYAALFAYTILLANVGLFSSVLCQRNRSAAGLTTLWFVGYAFIPAFAFAGKEVLRERMNAGQEITVTFWDTHATTVMPILDWIFNTSVFVQLYQSVEPNQDFTWTPQLISNSIGGVVLFLMSWGLFGFVSHESAAEATTRAMVPRRTGRLRWFSAGRTWNTSLAWKDFHFISGGWVGLLIRTGLYVGLYWLIYAGNCDWTRSNYVNPMRWQDVSWGYQFFVVPLFVADCAMCLSRLFQEEIRQQTLASLLMLPRSVTNIFYTKLMGCLLGLTPGAIAMFVAFCLLTESGNHVWENVDEPSVWWIIANLFLVIHLSALLSLYLRWGAFAMSLAITVGSMMMSGMILEMMFFMSGVRTIHPETILGLMAVMVFMACAACHFTILLRLPVLGEK